MPTYTISAVIDTAEDLDVLETYEVERAVTAALAHLGFATVNVEVGAEDDGSDSSADDRTDDDPGDCNDSRGDSTDPDDAEDDEEA